MSGLLDKLREVYGEHHVVDVFQGTGMAEHKERLGLGGYVVRGAVPHEQCAHWHKKLEDTLADIAYLHGPRSVDLKGSRLWYRTIQCTTGQCTCKYDYAGTARNPVFKTQDLQPFKHVCEWLHSTHKVARQDHFDEVVANIYSRPADQYIGAHTDQNPLLGETSEILSLTLGSAGVFFWCPSPDGQLRQGGAKEPSFASVSAPAFIKSSIISVAPRRAA